MTTHIAMVAMARWFTLSRGKALSIATMGYALGEATLPFAFVRLMDVVPWRGMWVGSALFLVLMLPVLVRLLRMERTPQAIAAESQSTGMNGWHWRRHQALRHWLFWCMMPAILGPSAFVTAFFFQQVHLADTKGWSHLQLVALFPVFTSLTVISMLLSGWVIDRIGTPRLMPFYQLPIAAGFALLGSSDGIGAAALAIGLMGMTAGANSTLPNAFWAEFYGTRHLGGIKALATAIMVLGSAIGPGLSGALIDIGVVFSDQMVGIALWFLASSALVAVAVGRARQRLALTL
jgi:MFS family permease